MFHISFLNGASNGISGILSLISFLLKHILDHIKERYYKPIDMEASVKSETQVPAKDSETITVESTSVENAPETQTVDTSTTATKTHHRKKSHASIFGSYISKMRDQLVDCPIRDNALTSLSDVLESITQLIIRESERLVIRNERKTLFASDLDTSIKVLFNLHKFTDIALDNAGFSIEKYNSTKTFESEGDKKKERKMRGTKAGLIFSVSRVENIIRNTTNENMRVAEIAPVFLTAFIQEVAKSILIASSNIAFESGKKMITPQFLSDGIHSIDVISTLCDRMNIHIAGSRRH